MQCLSMNSHLSPDLHEFYHCSSVLNHRLLKVWGSVTGDSSNHKHTSEL